MIAKVKDAAPWLIWSALALYLVIFTQLKVYIVGLLTIGAVYFAATALIALNPRRYNGASFWKEAGRRAMTAIIMFALAAILMIVSPVPTLPDSKDCIPRGRYDLC